MRLFIMTTIVAVGLGTTTPASAASTITLKDLADMCGSSADAEQRGCDLYILGASQGLNPAGTSEPAGDRFTERTTKRAFCLPDDTPTAVLRDKVLSSVALDLKAWPADAQLPAISWVAANLQRAYPCK